MVLDRARALRATHKVCGKLPGGYGSMLDRAMKEVLKGELCDKGARSS